MSRTRITSLVLAAAGGLFLTLTTGCATTLNSAVEPAECASLGWDECGRASACRHGRAFDATGDEHFVCVARYDDLISQLASPGVALDTASSRVISYRSETVAQP